MTRPILLPPMLALVLALWPLAAPATPTLVNGDAAMSDTLTGRWIVTELAEATLVPDVPVTMEFGPSGGISGKSACNSYSASLDVSGHDLSPGPARMTKMVCPAPVMAVEYAFNRALERLSRYEIAGDGTLVLWGFDTVVIRARREDAAQ